MAQFDVYENTDQNTHQANPYYLDVQSDLLADLATRVVIPLITKEYIALPVGILNPVVRVTDKTLYLSASQIQCLHKNRLGKKIADVTSQRQAVRAAMDFLLAVE